MNKQKLKRYLGDIENAARFFQQHFIHHEMIYHTEKQSISVMFKKSNFMHLCGIKYSDGATEFFNAAIAGKIDLAKIHVKSDGTTFLKLALLKAVDRLITPEVSLTGKGIYLHLAFDNALRTKKQIFALTLINNEYCFIP